MARFQKFSKEYLDFYRSNGACFGGDLLRGNPKTARPFTHLQGLHIVLRSSLAKGPNSMLRYNRRAEIQQLVHKQAKRFGVRLHSLANASNHLHILVKPSKNRADFAGFLRAISGLIARKTLKAQRGAPAKQRFWDKRPFTRVVPNQAFANCARYLEKNIFEAEGLKALTTCLRIFAQWQSSPS